MSNFSPRSPRPARRRSPLAALLARRLAVLAAPALLAGPLGAQDYVEQGDLLLRAGRMLAAESAYYNAARVTPRDPRARLALGRFLAARGQWKVGATLMEEARFFGGDPRAVAEALAPAYYRLGDFGALLVLPGSAFPPAERARLSWLRDNPPAVAGPDSADVRFVPDPASALGRVVIYIGGDVGSRRPDSILATIDPRVQGLVLDTAWSRHAGVRLFGSRSVGEIEGTPHPDGAGRGAIIGSPGGRRPAGRSGGTGGGARPAPSDAPRSAASGTLAVTHMLVLGAMTVRNVPTRLVAGGGARVGLDILGLLAPTFDARAGRITLHRGGVIPPRGPGEHLPTLNLPGGLWLSRGETLAPLDGAEAGQLLRARAWTLNPRRGEVVVR